MVSLSTGLWSIDPTSVMLTAACLLMLGINSQAENQIVNTWPDSGPPRQEDGLLNHVDLVQMLDIVDLEAGTTVAGMHAHSLPV